VPTEPRTRGPRAVAKRDMIAETALHAFAERGYQGTKVEDVAAELAISKGSVFQHFGSKAGLFLAAFRKAVEKLPAWLDAPDEVRPRASGRSSSIGSSGPNTWSRRTGPRTG
jgi:AcrR family transcriptional regulator